MADLASKAAANDDRALIVSDLAVGYGRKVVLENISFELQAGRIAALIGVNGAGKSTTLKTIVGVLRPVRGSVWFDGHPLGGTVADNVQAGLALVPEGARSFADLSVRENLEMGGFILANGGLVRQRIDDVLHFFPRLRERLNQKAGVLSGGERQMLAIGRALMIRPRYLLLDEPFLGLAPIMIQEVSRRLEDLAKQTSCGLLIAEQQIAATLRFCTRAFAISERKFFEIESGSGQGFDAEAVSRRIFAVV